VQYEVKVSGHSSESLVVTLSCDERARGSKGGLRDLERVDWVAPELG
jgi:hypothetical protein